MLSVEQIEKTVRRAIGETTIDNGTVQQYEHFVREMTTAFVAAQQQQASAQEGWKLVPTTLQDYQLAAIYNAPDEVHGGGWERLYTNMYALAVAAAAPTQQQEG